ncbi:hypothetical protein [Candidatus Stoquefichus massiliensis]|uniref:hypothetical protein n=1 Tax=Candidatus Stoquefichus massiliensis TaxID=1470350 RepID=UPI00047F5DE0|nr:hypothetical protein [Candidatus Stoquefichus massiliensis]
MEKQTRINKYKELREEMKEEVAIDRHVVETSDDADDDFLAFLPKDEKQSVDDTLIEPLSYETLKKDNEEVKMALNQVKVNVGKEQYNTRLDILNKIKQEEEHVPAHSYDETDAYDFDEEPRKKMSLLEKLAAMSPEEDAEELKKFEEDLTVADLMHESKKHKKQKPRREEQMSEPEIIEEDEPEEESKVVTILNYVIVIFIVVFIVLAFFIVKQLLF